ncbi:hypothetical protein [Burkholderia cepacia]|uniref:hypothetical protein n=1 Tax=Burkholderia cepacia TaxID=292 RepID=UPI000F5B6BDE|nr:hypothetical protein [Burkholderia cepacia]
MESLVMLERRSGYLLDKLIDESGRIIATFDLSRLDIHPDLVVALLRAHAAEFGHNEIETQKQAHRCIRKFILFLQEIGLHKTVPLPSNICIDFHRWLADSGLKSSTAQSVQNVMMSMLRWCGRNASGILSKNPDFIVPRFVRNAPAEKREFTPDFTRRVLAACYGEIEKIESRISYGASLSSGDLLDEERDRFLASVIKDLLVIGQGVIPNQKLVNRSGLGLARRVGACGGLRYIRSLLSVTVPDILPFYLAVIVQTGGNPIGIQKIKTDCIKSHPLRTDLEFLDWDKPRAGREQRVDFPKAKQWSAPNVIRRLLRINENLRSDCNEMDKRYVFLSRDLSGVSQAAVVPSVQSLHNYLAIFIENNEFPEFDFRDWRPNLAREHRGASGSIEGARKRLNHRDVRTTSLYVNTQNFESKDYQAIASFQGQLIRGPHGRTDRLIDKLDEDGSSLARAGTVFGFECSDPFAGLDGVTEAGSRCLNFTRCSTCPGSLIPLDDPRVISRILGAKMAIEEARDRSARQGWLPRYEKLYAGTLRIIDQEILPVVSSSILERAKKEVMPHHIPHLE